MNGTDCTQDWEKKEDNVGAQGADFRTLEFNVIGRVSLPANRCQKASE